MAIYERMTIRGRGGALPEYQRQGGVYTPGAQVNARIDDSPARIVSAGRQEEARAFGNLGRSIKGAVDVGLKAYDDYSKSKATQLITEYRRGMNTALFGENGIMTRKGEDALNADGERAEAARRLRESLIKDAGAFTKHYFNLMADDYDAKTSLQAQRYAREQRTVMLNRNDDAAAEERADFAMHSFNNAEDFAQGLGEGLWHRRQRLIREGYSGEALDLELKKYSSAVFSGGIKQALAQDDADGAARLLRQGAGKVAEGVITTRGKAGSIADDQNNPLNLRAAGGGAGRKGFRTFLTPEEGLRAADAQILRYIAGKTTGTAVDTPEKIIRTWAPSNENDTEGYIKAVAKISGLDMSARINPNTEEGRKALDKLISAMAMQESSWKISPDEVAAARLGKNAAMENMPESGGRMTHSDIAWARDAIRSKHEGLQAKAEEAAKRREKEAHNALIEETAQEMLQQLADFPSKEKEAKALLLTANIQDAGVRQGVRAVVHAAVKEEELLLKAHVVEELGLIERTFAQNPNMTTAQRLELIRKGNFAYETKEKARREIMDSLEGKENAKQSALRLVAFRRWFDANEGAPKAEAEAKMLDLGLNSKDRQRAGEYMNMRHTYPQEYIFALIKEVKGDNDMARDNSIYEYILREAKHAGRVLSLEEIKAMIHKYSLTVQSYNEPSFLDSLFRLFGR